MKENVYAGIKRISFGSFDGEEISMLFGRPDTQKAVPCVVFIHGGGWDSCSADYYLRHMKRIIRGGSASASVEYRLKTQDTHISRCVGDCAAAVRYLRSHAAELGIAAGMVCVVGESAGGHLALCLSSPLIVDDALSRPDLTVNLNGVLNMTETFSDRFFSEEERNDFSDAGSWMERYEEEERWSPAFRVSEKNSPVIHFQGLKDKVVHPEETVRYHRKLLSCGVESELLLLPEMNHAFILYDYDNPDEVVDSILEKICDRLASHGYLEQ